MAERASLGSGRLSDMLRIARHRLATSLVSVLAAFIVVDGMRRIVDQQARAYHGWAVAVLLALLAYAIAMYILLSSARGRQRLNFDGARAGSAPVILLAIAWSPVLLPPPSCTSAHQPGACGWHSACSAFSSGPGTTSYGARDRPESPALREKRTTLPLWSGKLGVR